MIEKCKCIKCIYCKRFYSQGVRIDIYCRCNERELEKKWKLQKAVGYIGAEKKGVFPIKKTPKWCPLEVERGEIKNTRLPQVKKRHSRDFEFFEKDKCDDCLLEERAKEDEAFEEENED